MEPRVDQDFNPKSNYGQNTSDYNSSFGSIFVHDVVGRKVDRNEHDHINQRNHVDF